MSDVFELIEASKASIINSMFSNLFEVIMSEKRYLVYKKWNGQIHTSIEYGNHTTGEGKLQKNTNELQRFEITHSTEDLNILKQLYPLTVKVLE